MQSLIDEVPDVEAEFARLNRDYDVVYAQYRTILNSLEREKLSSEAQLIDRVAFRIIDPPTASINPVEPQRARLLVMVLIAGIAIGAGYAFLRTQINPVFDSEHKVQSVIPLPVLGTVSFIWEGKLRKSGSKYDKACSK